MNFSLRFQCALAQRSNDFQSTSSTYGFPTHSCWVSDEFLVVPGLSEEVIIGAATMQKWRIKLNFEYDTAEVDPKVAKLILKNLI